MPAFLKQYFGGKGVKRLDLDMVCDQYRIFGERLSRAFGRG